MAKTPKVDASVSTSVDAEAPSAPSRKAVAPDGFVRVVVPERYGVVDCVTPEGRKSVKGGEVVTIRAKQASALGAEPA